MPIRKLWTSFWTRYKRPIAYSFMGLGILLIVAGIGLYVFRDRLAREAITRVDQKLQAQYQCHLKVENLHFEGLSRLHLDRMCLYPNQGDTLAYVGQLQLQIAPWRLLLGQLQVESLQLHTAWLQWTKQGNRSNWDPFFTSDTTQTRNNSSTDYKALAQKVCQRLMRIIPTQVQAQHVALRFNHHGHRIVLDCPQFQLQQQQLRASCHISAPEGDQQWILQGTADPRQYQADLRWTSATTDSVHLPFLAHRLGLQLGFKEAKLRLDGMDNDQGAWVMQGAMDIQGGHCIHPKISSKPVRIQHATLQLCTRIYPRAVELDSSSYMQLEQLRVHPYVRYDKSDGKRVQLAVRIPNTLAQAFIDALPQGLFTHLRGMKATGNFAYDLHFDYDEAHPKDVVFDSHFQPHNLHITQYGEAQLNKLNQAFEYRAIERGMRQRPVWVGPENPQYYSLDQLPTYLISSILTCEDPSFFHHKGFITEAFKQSIVRNIKTRKFARGASTISMQLVKNVFLTREKTLSRKLEEILLVYILENQRIASKQRMLEVYCNLIEWGPNVYGIGEAARFYFDKTPDQLTYAECLYLATIIPKPKGFMGRFAHQEALKNFAQKQHDFLTRLQLKRRLITPEDTLGMHQPLRLLGPARQFLKARPDSTFMDTVEPLDVL